MRKLRQTPATIIVNDQEIQRDNIRKQGKPIKECNIIFNYYTLTYGITEEVMYEITGMCQWPVSKYQRGRKWPGERISNLEKEKIIDILTRRMDKFQNDFVLFIASAKVDKMMRKKRHRYAKIIIEQKEEQRDRICKQEKPIEECNIIFYYYTLIYEITDEVMYEITEECDWSVSKYHRKRKMPGEAISNLEKEKIIEILTRKMDEFQKDFRLFIASAKADKNLKIGR